LSVVVVRIVLVRLKNIVVRVVAAALAVLVPLALPVTRTIALALADAVDVPLAEPVVLANARTTPDAVLDPLAVPLVSPCA
jgi:hypothetical protein